MFRSAYPRSRPLPPGYRTTISEVIDSYSDERPWDAVLSTESGANAIRGNRFDGTERDGNRDPSRLRINSVSSPGVATTTVGWDLRPGRGRDVA
ncbi:hypothetical protein [Natronorubrum halophilum]|uniref:hypothetical protein n=1 Tax=Natronorubrum halophilum TaxID=1702106 RepID=UPI0010C1D49C|nr:hypothetical protein [Natronorubrum halophilum]